MTSSSRPSRSSLSTFVRDEDASFNDAVANRTGDEPALHLGDLLQKLTACCKTLKRAQLRQVYRAFSTCKHQHAGMPGMCHMGRLFESGTAPLPRDVTLANFFYETCATRNNCVLSRYLLACNLESGAGGSKDLVRASQLYEQVIEQSGLTAAMRRLARLLGKGSDAVPQDAVRAVALYERVISLTNSTDAIDALAEIYAKGLPGVSACAWRSQDLFEASLDIKEGSRALVGLAFILTQGGDDVEMDLPRAVELYERAIAKDGNPNALNNLALILSEGAEGIRRDLKRAAMLWEAASAKGHMNAKRSLARLMENGSRTVSRDRTRAVELYEEIVDDERFKGVRFNLAWLLSSSLDNVPQDLPRAVKLYQQVIDEDEDVNAMFNLACLLADGMDGVKRDLPRAAALYERAIAVGDHIRSMHALGVLLSSDGHGMQKNVQRAVEVLERAVEAGWLDATFDLALVLSGGNEGVPIDIQGAMKRYEELIETTNHIGAMINMAEILFDGKHNVQSDSERAMVLCERAMACGLSDNPEVLSKIGVSYKSQHNPSYASEAENARVHAVQQGWHIIAMTSLVGMLLSTGNKQNMDKAILVLEAACSDPLFPVLYECGQVDFSTMFRTLKRLMVDECQGLIPGVVRIFEIVIAGSEDEFAMYTLGKVLMKGAAGVARDAERGVALYKRAASKGEEQAMFELGMVFSCGLDGFETDLAYAFDSFARVLSAGVETHLMNEAAVNLALIARQI